MGSNLGQCLYERCPIFPKLLVPLGRTCWKNEGVTAMTPVLKIGFGDTTKERKGRNRSKNRCCSNHFATITNAA
jgi:hypothetical protein